MAIISFGGRANIGIRIVQEKYPGAYLYEIDGKATDGPTKDPNNIDRMRIVCGRYQGSETIIIKEKSFNEFGEPQAFEKPWLEDVIVKWPITMDLPEAIQLKEKADCKDPFEFVTVRNPLGPKPGNPYFIFSNRGSDEHVFVDIITKKVHVVESAPV